MNVAKPKIFKWSQRYQWQKVLRRLLADEINETVIAQARKISPKYLADDDFAWLNLIVSRVNKKSQEDIVTLLERRLSNYYEFIIAFHGTRSDSAADFLDHGVRVSNCKVLEMRRFRDSETATHFLT